MLGFRRKPGEQQQESIPTNERLNLPITKQGRSNTIQDKAGNFLTEDQDILQSWTEYCSELYSYRATEDPSVLHVPPATNNDNHPILREEVESAVRSLKKAEISKSEKYTIRNSQDRRRSNEQCLTDHLQYDPANRNMTNTMDTSLTITLHKKGTVQQCQNYRTISLISHPSTAMLEIQQNMLKPQAENIIAEE
ncbi:uncharacterized protein LOC125646944 [Ostrea edulis]|uniref:uncharacterized protein LOC125646944 n=1 Tax=Ostrea edulis TaxID=37623 RepID=UPI002094F675|nr:uncharacterized protein LOC125646944 [Ostrea edulis]